MISAAILALSGVSLLNAGEYEDDSAQRARRKSDLQTVKLTPRVRSESVFSDIPTIPPSAIHPFLTSPLLVEEGQLDGAPHVVVGVDDNIILGRGSEFYARGLKDETLFDYQVFRPGKTFMHPDTGELLGYEALYLGDAQLIEFGETSRMVLTASQEAIGPGDRLMPSERSLVIPTFNPHKPDAQVHGRILSTLGGVKEFGRLSVATVTLGKREGMEPGHVLRVMRHGGQYKDPVDGKSYDLPNSDSGLIMVFRTFEKMSYGLVVKSNRALRVLDEVETP
ncbi:MAG: peptidoglycan-binding protein LysM [Gammaproteobacteria bacterium]|nr:peptidoglycan-binding protein LysM [Gammaproteobacteria bacterium]